MTLALCDDVPLELVLVPAGDFLMGSTGSNERSSEIPQHVVRFERPFYIGRFPITQEQWMEVMGRNPSFHKGEPNLPVDQVSWFNCQEFCEVLSKRQQRIVRLPTEAEWEYACRAGTTTTFAFGDTLSPDQANFKPSWIRSPYDFPPVDDEEAMRKFIEEPGEVDQKPRPTPVGSYPPNAWGIYEMHGNVYEWCEDAWHDNYEGAPVDGSAWHDGEENRPARVVRGGWCSGYESACTSASRAGAPANVGEPIRIEYERFSELEAMSLESLRAATYRPYGFRVVCEVD